jgi:hypothetical protein
MSTPLLTLSLSSIMLPLQILNSMLTSPPNPPLLFVLPLSLPPCPPDTALANPSLPTILPPSHLAVRLSLLPPPFALSPAPLLPLISPLLHPPDTTSASSPLPNPSPPHLIISPLPPPQPPDPVPVNSAKPQLLPPNSNHIATSNDTLTPHKVHWARTWHSKLLQQDSR